MLHLSLVVLTLCVGTRTKPILEDFTDAEFDSEEFEYFYNLELVEKLSQIDDGNKTNELTENDIKILIAEDTSNNTKVDDVLDRMEKEGNLIEEVLNEIEVTTKAAILKEELKSNIDFSASILYEILYWIFLACFILMLVFSVTVTGKYFLENPKSSFQQNSLPHRANLEFMFFPGKP